MPEPHPSIAYSRENDADGLEWRVPGSEPHSFMWPHFIETRLISVEWGCDEIVSASVAAAIKANGGPQPLTGARAALRDRIAARLELSRGYRQMEDDLSDKIGLTAINEKMDNIATRQCDAENRILKMKSTSRSDIAIKLAIYDAQDRDNWVAGQLVPDLRRLVDAHEVAA
jgi:hypothetical protein